MASQAPAAQPALADTAHLAALTVRAFRDKDPAGEDAVTLALLPIVGDTAKTYALVAHLAAIAVQASTPEALEQRLAVTERMAH